MIWVLTKRQQSQDGSKFKKWVFYQGVKGWTAELFQVWNIQFDWSSRGESRLHRLKCTLVCGVRSSEGIGFGV